MCVILNISNISFASQENIKDFTIKFVENSLSDFSNEENIMVDNISNEEVLNFIKDKNQITDLKQTESGRTWKLSSMKLDEFDVKELENGTYDVAASFVVEFLDGDTPSSYMPRYRMIIENVDANYFVKAAMSDDLGSVSLVDPLIKTDTFDFPLEYQLDDIKMMNSKNSIDTPYDLSKSKASLENLYNEIKNDNNSSSTLQNIQRASNFRYFSATDLANMKRYQDNHYNHINPNFYNFHNLGGNCTNYVSQVLYAGGATQNTRASSGIAGTNYWFYRTSNDRSSSWTGVDEFRTFVLNNNTKGPMGYLVNRFSDLRTGSVIQFKTSNSRGIYGHSVIVYNQGGDPYVTSNSPFVSGYYSTLFGGPENLKIRIDGYYQ